MGRNRQQNVNNSWLYRLLAFLLTAPQLTYCHDTVNHCVGVLLGEMKLYIDFAFSVNSPHWKDLNRSERQMAARPTYSIQLELMPLWHWSDCSKMWQVPSATEVPVKFMMTTSNGNPFCVTGPLCGEFTGHGLIPCTKASDAELWCFLWSAPWMNDWVYNRDAGDLRRHRADYDVIVML